MTTFLHWRVTTWVLVLWSGYLAVWMVVTGSGPVIVALWWLAGLGLLQLILQPLYQSGRIVPPRRHGPFDLRVSPRPNAPRPRATKTSRETRGQTNTGDVRLQNDAVQDWESEGGAIVERPRASPTAQAA
jgi:hypothetical protein